MRPAQLSHRSCGAWPGRRSKTGCLQGIPDRIAHFVGVSHLQRECDAGVSSLKRRGNHHCAQPGGLFRTKARQPSWKKISRFSTSGAFRKRREFLLFAEAARPVESARGIYRRRCSGARRKRSAYGPARHFHGMAAAGSSSRAAASWARGRLVFPLLMVLRRSGWSLSKRHPTACHRSSRVSVRRRTTCAMARPAFGLNTGPSIRFASSLRRCRSRAPRARLGKMPTIGIGPTRGPRPRVMLKIYCWVSMSRCSAVRRRISS